MSKQIEYAKRFAEELWATSGNDDSPTALDVLDVLAGCGLEFIEAQGTDASVAYQDAVQNPSADSQE